MIKWSSGLARSRDKLETLYLQYHSAFDHQNWWDGDITWGAPNHKVIRHFDHRVLLDHMANWNYYICNITVPMATKLGRVMKYVEGLLTIKSCNALINMIFWGLCNKQKPLHLYYQRVHCHQTWQDGNLPWRTRTHNVTWLFDYVVLQDHFIEKQPYYRFHLGSVIRESNCF